MTVPYTQIRIARPTANLAEIIRFYEIGLGLKKIGNFEDHDGYSGVMFGLPDETYHLEFTQYSSPSSLPSPHKDNLLVFYYPDTTSRNTVANKLITMGYKEVEPENPYWKTHGITIEDPDRWRVVLMDIPGFKALS